MRQFTLRAECGLAVPLPRGQHLRVINTFGTQVVDTWAIAADDPTDYLSMEHCREVIQRIVFEPGDVLLTNHYRPILEIITDTSPGGHDTLIAACSEPMYRRAGAAPGHASCAGNLAAALALQGVKLGFTPQPWNLFMIARVPDGRSIEYHRPVARPGDYVELQALMDCTMVFSACPDDVYPTNGGDGRARDVELVLLD
jgi:uncharacterized protein YcgI (DUF1989 family)